MEAKAGAKNTASGQDTDFGQSPFSAAFHSQKPREVSGDFKGSFAAQRNDHGYFGKQHKGGKF
jgi:hypothetical protein